MHHFKVGAFFRHSLEWTAAHLVWRQSIHFWRRCARKKNNFYIFVPNDLDLWPLDLKFAHMLILLSSPLR